MEIRNGMRSFRLSCRRWGGSVERTSNDVPSLDGTPRSSMFHAEERKGSVLPIAGLYRQEASGFMWKNVSVAIQDGNWDRKGMDRV